MTAKQILEQINKGVKFNIIDVRQKERYDAYHLPSAINVEKGLMFESPEKIIDNKSDKWYVTCNGGNSAGMIAETLKAQGYNIESIEGGMSTLLNID